MKDSKELQRFLYQIDGKGYKAYKDIAGIYRFNLYSLAIDYVQGDPFAAPSRIRVIVDQKNGKFPQQFFDQNHKRIAVVDFLTRLFARNIAKYYERVGGSGKSGVLTIDRCGQEMLDRTSVVIDKNKIEARLEVGLPAAGRRILGRAAYQIIGEMLPQIVKETLFFDRIDGQALKNQIELVEDQQYIRKELKKRGWIGFVANGSVLPRESGISQKPLRKGVIPFQSPKSLEAEIELPNKGSMRGMAVPEGVTLIVGGGYHGKSTLLKALEHGVYNHIQQDGREYVITLDKGVKIRAEDGRSVEKVNISPFISNLPNGQNTKAFSTENASGSTSQAANIIEALEVGTDLLFIDEDTSATNFMIRDSRMQQLVHKNKEPITPFIDKVTQLYKDYGVSTVLVIGGSGDYFDIADTVIMMDEYRLKDVTKEAKEIAKSTGNNREIQSDKDFGEISHRIVLKSSFPQSRKGVKIKAHGVNMISYDRSNIELQNVEQLIDSSQANCIAMLLYYMMNHLADDRKTLLDIIETIYETIEKNGLDTISFYKGHPGNLALPRKYEIAAALNRLRLLKTRIY